MAISNSCAWLEMCKFYIHFHGPAWDLVCIDYIEIDMYLDITLNVNKNGWTVSVSISMHTNLKSRNLFPPIDYIHFHVVSLCPYLYLCPSPCILTWTWIYINIYIFLPILSWTQRFPPLMIVFSCRVWLLKLETAVWNFGSWLLCLLARVLLDRSYWIWIARKRCYERSCDAPTILFSK